MLNQPKTLSNNRFTPDVVAEYAALQKLLYDAVDDVLIRYWGDCWYCFCPTVKQTLLATLIVAGESLENLPESLEAVNPENGRRYDGFKINNHYILYRPEKDDPTSRIRVTEVREFLAQHLHTLARFLN